MKHLNLVFFSLLLLSLVLLTFRDSSAQSPAPINATFLNLDNYYFGGPDYSDLSCGSDIKFSKISNILNEFHSLGIDKVIIHHNGMLDNDGIVKDSANFKKLKWVFDYIKDKIENDGWKMDVYLGLYAFEDGAGGYNDKYWLDRCRQNVIDCDVRLAGQIFREFHTKDNEGNLIYPFIKGFYIPQEISIPSYYSTQADLLKVLEYFHEIVKGIRDWTGKNTTNAYIYQVIAGGYMDPFTVSPGNSLLPPSDIGAWIKCYMYGGRLPDDTSKSVIGMDADIFLLQDGVGSADIPMINPLGGPNLALYLEAARNAINDTEIPRKLWVVVELFQYSGVNPSGTNVTNWLNPSSIRQVNLQLYIDRQYADDGGIVSWLNRDHLTDLTTEANVNNNIMKKGAKHLLRGYKALYKDNGNYFYEGSEISYTYDTSPIASNADPGYTKLLDGNVGQERAFASHLDEWVGFNSTGPISINIDLNSSKPVSDISVTALSKAESGIKYPINFYAWVSESKDDIDNIANLLGHSEPISLTSTTSLTDCYTDNSIPQTNATFKNHGFSSRNVFILCSDLQKQGRYVKIKIYPNGNSKVLLSEIEVYGSPTSPKFASKNSELFPDSFTLAQNYPNPFNPTTRIEYSVAHAGYVNLKVYDTLGKEIATLVNGYKTAGTYFADFNANILPSGIYIYRLTSEGININKKMILLK